MDDPNVKAKVPDRDAETKVVGILPTQPIFHRPNYSVSVLPWSTHSTVQATMAHNKRNVRHTFPTPAKHLNFAVLGHHLIVSPIEHQEFPQILMKEPNFSGGDKQKRAKLRACLSVHSLVTTEDFPSRRDQLNQGRISLEVNQYSTKHPYLILTNAPLRTDESRMRSAESEYKPARTIAALRAHLNLASGRYHTTSGSWSEVG